MQCKKCRELLDEKLSDNVFVCRACKLVYETAVGIRDHAIMSPLEEYLEQK